MKIIIPSWDNSFTLCLVGVILGGMENIEWKTEWKTVFFTVWEREENRERGKPRRKFSLPGPQISSPQIGRKSLSGKLIKSTFTQMPSHSQRSLQLSKEERRQFSNHQLSTTQLSPQQPKNNWKSAQNNLKSNPISTENQLKIKPLCFNHHHHHLLSSL